VSVSRSSPLRRIHTTGCTTPNNTYFFAAMLATLRRETICEQVSSLPLTGSGSRKVIQALEKIAPLGHIE
jgi:hypothetical protein